MESFATIVNGFFGAAHWCVRAREFVCVCVGVGGGRGGGGGEGGWTKTSPFPNICHTYATMMKLSTVIRSTKYIAWVLLTSAFFDRKLANFAILRNTDVDCILKHNF